MNPRSIALAISLSLLIGCGKPTADDVRAEFVAAHTCPADRVVVHERSDLTAHDVIFGKASPPADIAHDPERLSMWQKHEADVEAKWNNGTYVFEVQGCAAHVLSACYRSKSSVWSRYGSSSVSCSEHPLPADEKQ